MGTSVAAAGWIKRVVEDERRRDTVRLKEDEMAARKAELVHRDGGRLIADLRTTVTRDVTAFRGEFSGDRARDVVIDDATPDGGFVVRKPAPGGVSLTITPDLAAAAIVCHYRFMPNNGLPPREDRIHVMFAGHEGGSLHMKHHGTGQVFATADTLSEFLLVPVLTGRPR